MADGEREWNYDVTPLGRLEKVMVGTRGKGEVRSATNHLGFRCVMDARKQSEQR